MNKEKERTGRMCSYCHGNFVAWNCGKCDEGMEIKTSTKEQK